MYIDQDWRKCIAPLLWNYGTNCQSDTVVNICSWQVMKYYNECMSSGTKRIKASFSRGKQFKWRKVCAPCFSKAKRERETDSCAQLNNTDHTNTVIKESARCTDAYVCCDQYVCYVCWPPRWPSGTASTSRAEDPGFRSRLRRDFFGVKSYQWLQNWHSSGYPARRLAL